MMAPNKWISSTKSLQRPLRLADQCSSVIVTISHLPESANIQIYVHDMEGVSLKSEQAILVCHYYLISSFSIFFYK